MVRYLLITKTLLTLCLLPHIVLACSSSRPKKFAFEYETRTCVSDLDLITGFVEPISESSLSSPICLQTFSNVFDVQNRVANWWAILDHENKWAHCPAGYFLRGFHFTKHQFGLFALEQGMCAKSSGYPSQYGDCYQEDMSESTKCFDGYYVTGIYKGNCKGWDCVKKLKCCNFTSSEFKVDSFEAAKEEIMARSQYPLAELEANLGFCNPIGCHGKRNGDNMDKDGTAWVVKRCPKDGGGKGLRIEYGDWTLSLSNMEYSKAKMTSLAPITIDSGVMVNKLPIAVSELVTRTDSVIRSVKHTRVSAWKISSGLDVKVGYTPPGGAGGVTFEANMFVHGEKSEETRDETGNTQRNELITKRNVVMPAHSSAEWRARLYRTRTSQSYRATILIECSVKLGSCLRKGDGPNSENTNYHREHAGKHKEDISYSFGGKSYPFYFALKKESEQWSEPWMWGDLFTRRPFVMNVINYLTSTGQYEFPIEGKFDEVQGYKTDIEFDNFVDLSVNGAPVDSFGEMEGKGENKTIVARLEPGDPESEFDPDVCCGGKSVKPFILLSLLLKMLLICFE